MSFWNVVSTSCVTSAVTHARVTLSWSGGPCSSKVSEHGMQSVHVSALKPPVKPHLLVEGLVALINLPTAEVKVAIGLVEELSEAAQTKERLQDKQIMDLRSGCVKLAS